MRPNPADIYAAPVDDLRMGRLKEYMLRSESLGECTALKLTESKLMPVYVLQLFQSKALLNLLNLFSHTPTLLPVMVSAVMIDGQPAKMGNNADFVVGEKMARALTSLMRQYPDFRISDINSGQRTPEHNAKVGGVANSSHLRGNAIDVTVGSPGIFLRTWW